MKVLFIGGTGIISTACTRLAVERGIELTLLRRGQTGGKHSRFRAHDRGRYRRRGGGGAGAWRAEIRRRGRLDRLHPGPGRARHPPVPRPHAAIHLHQLGQRLSEAGGHYLITESTPLANPYWQYSRDKIACEERLMREYRESGFPVTIVRPSLTYGDTQIVLAVNSWQKSYTAVDRMRRGKKVIVPGDGSSLWVVTHNSDFAQGLVGLLGHQPGHRPRLSHHQRRSADLGPDLSPITAQAAGVEPQLVHIASDFLGACMPEHGRRPHRRQSRQRGLRQQQDQALCSRLLRHGAVCAKASRRPSPGSTPTPGDASIDDEANAAWDKILSGYESGLGEAQRRFGP